MRVSLHVEAAGPMTSVQDLGRFGAQSLGIPTAGALDPVSLRLANALVGNPQGAAGLECRFLGPRLRVSGGPVRVALAGTETALEVLSPDRRLVPNGQSVTFEDGQSFRLGPVADTSCCYLAIAGGIDLPEQYGSLSTHAPSGIGGINGRALADGDEIPLRASTAAPGQEFRLVKTVDLGRDRPIRVVLGPQEEYFSAAAIETFLTGAYTVSPQSNRMGLRLDGPVLSHAKGFNIPSDGIVTGAIQVPGAGLPIVLMADRQTTGGYPKIATVISADLPRLGRMRPGETLRFVAVEVAEAEALRHRQEAEITAVIKAMERGLSGHHTLAALLMTENLISGAVSPSMRDAV